MVCVSSWGLQRRCVSNPPFSESCLMKLHNCSRWLKHKPASFFLAPIRLSCFLPLCSSSTDSSGESGAKESGRPLLVGLGLNMSPSKLTSDNNGAQGKEPQELGAPGFLETRGAVELHRSPAMGDAIKRQTVMDRGESDGGNIQGIPHWATARAAKPSPPKLLTLVIIQKDGKVLLGMKKRGFGKGYYNGFGGKVEKGETIDEAAARELQEESGVVPVDMSKRGILTFHFDNDLVPWEVHVFHVSEIVGDPCETEEMAPRWFAISDIPYGTMWSDDILWYPEFLKGRHFKGNFYFENTTTLVAHSLQVLATQ